jgi:lipid-binding SYLF domain-containing protein
MAGGSFGFQAGIQDAEVLMTIMNDKALNAIINSQFRLGAEAGLSIANLGAGIAGGTTSAVGADVVVFSKTRGLFAGVSIEGALMSFQHERNVAYYGKDVSSRQIVVGMEAHNQGSDVLRSTLMNLATAGERTTGVTARPNMPQYIGQSAEPARTQGMAIPSGRVSSESLPPISGRR